MTVETWTDRHVDGNGDEEGEDGMRNDKRLINIWLGETDDADPAAAKLAGDNLLSFRRAAFTQIVARASRGEVEAVRWLEDKGLLTPAGDVRPLAGWGMSDGREA